MVTIRSNLFLKLAVSALGLAACDSGSSSPGGTADATTATDTQVATTGNDATTATPDTTTTPDTTVNPGGCDKSGFTAASQTYDAQSGYAVLHANTGDKEPVDSLAIEIYQGSQFVGGATEPGTYDLANPDLGEPNYATCSNCVVIRTGCTSAGGCDKTFFAHKGNLVISQWDVLGGRFKGHLEGLELKEVTIDSNSYVSTEVEGGEGWCIDNFDFDAEVKAIPVSTKTQDTCVENGTGTILHDNVGNLTLKNCNGDPVQLHATCGGESQAMWIIGTAGWCTACHEFINAFRLKHTNGILDRATIAKKTPGLDMLIILAENNDGEKPSQEFCKAYAEDMKLDPAMVVLDWSDRDVTVNLVDPEGYSITTNALGRTWSFIDPYLTADSSGSVTTAYPWWAILKATNMEYMWSDNAQIETMDQVFEDLLGRFPSELFN
ncbi:MAG: hypothetical protein U1F43_29730 [Myxococcota bacterium]